MTNPSQKTIMINKSIIGLATILTICVVSCQNEEISKSEDMVKEAKSSIELTLEEANRLASLPLECIQNPMPYKPGYVLSDSSDLKMPIEHHPAFYGCFDWHSAVHGHWSLVYLLKQFPDLENAEDIRTKLKTNLGADNILKELSFFQKNDYNKSFERTYGWAWLLKLTEELYEWKETDQDALELYNNLQPLSEFISKAYIEYLPKLVYAIRVGEHSNTAFGLSFAYDYALATGDLDLKQSIEENAKRLYSNDKDCPINWEPSGYDFLSPCLQELDIMRKILTPEEFENWSANFLPKLADGSLDIEPGKVLDRTDGKLVHLDGLNFSRAWCLYPIADNDNAFRLAEEHMKYSLDKIVDGDYAGQHWLASFALYAYKTKAESH